MKQASSYRMELIRNSSTPRAEKTRAGFSRGFHEPPELTIRRLVLIAEALEAKWKPEHCSWHERTERVKWRCAKLRIPYDTASLYLAFDALDEKRRRAGLPVFGESPAVSDHEPEAVPMVPHDDCVRFLESLRLHIRAVPDAEPVLRQTVAQVKAVQFVAAAIVESVARCEALEAELNTGDT